MSSRNILRLTFLDRDCDRSRFVLRLSIEIQQHFTYEKAIGYFDCISFCPFAEEVEPDVGNPECSLIPQSLYEDAHTLKFACTACADAAPKLFFTIPTHLSFQDGTGPKRIPELPKKFSLKRWRTSRLRQVQVMREVQDSVSQQLAKLPPRSSRGYRLYILRQSRIDQKTSKRDSRKSHDCRVEYLAKGRRSSPDLLEYKNTPSSKHKRQLRRQRHSQSLNLQPQIPAMFKMMATKISVASGAGNITSCATGCVRREGQLLHVEISVCKNNSQTLLLPNEVLNSFKMLGTRYPLIKG